MKSKMKKVFVRKKVVFAVLMSIFLAAPLSGCESDEAKRETITRMINDLSDTSKGKAAEMTSLVAKYGKEEVFSALSVEKLDALFSEKNYTAAATFLTNLEKNKYNGDSVKTALKNNVEKLQEESFKSEDPYTIFTYLESVTPFDDLNYYTEGIILIPTDQIITYGKNHGKKIITKDGQGGYFDSRKDKYKSSESKWYDPLGQKYLSTGEIGTFKNIVRYDFMGDILCVIREKKWWTHDGTKNSADEKNTEYWYTENYELTSRNVANAILEHEGYFLGKENQFVLITYDNKHLYLSNNKGLLTYNR